MTRQCKHCADTGVVITNTWELGDPVFSSDCECPIGRAFTAPFIGPPPPTSAWLYDNETDKHRAAVKAEGLRECWTCSGWHGDGETCPEIHQGGWLAPQYRTGVTT